MTEPLPTRCLLHQVLYQRTSPYGDPYAVALMIDPAGNTHTALACSKLFGDLDKLSELDGLSDPLFVEEDPPASSTAASAGSAPAALTDLAITVANLARDLKLPTAMWIHFP